MRNTIQYSTMLNSEGVSSFVQRDQLCVYQSGLDVGVTSLPLFLSIIDHLNLVLDFRVLQTAMSVCVHSSFYIFFEYSLTYFL